MTTNDENDNDDDDGLPFDVELERLPVWTHITSALVVVTGVLIAFRLAPMVALLPFLVASSLGRRFASSARHVVVDGNGIDLGGRTIARADLVDVWVDDDATEPRATLAFGKDIELALLHFVNREQARRFGGAFTNGGLRAAVVGHKPVPVDMLASLRFVAIAAGFFGTGSWYGLFVLVFFALGAWNVVRAKQLVARSDGFEVRTLLGTESHTYAEVASVDLDAGLIALKSGVEITLPRGALRDPTLASPAWLERARTRVLGQVRQRGRDRA